MKLLDPILKPKPKKNYKFSIIMPNYNNERFIEQSIRSVLNQTYKDWELYIIDDLSTDRSVEFTKMVINNKCKLVINDRKKLNGGSRNVGIELAKKSNPDGYIMCLDSDDWFKDENVLKDINENINDRDVLVLGFEMWNGKKVIYEQMPEYEDHFELFQANHGICCAVWNKVIKTSIMPYFQEGTLMEDRVHHYKTISRARTYGGLDRITHTWNKSNNNSITSNKTQNYNKQIKWDNCAYRHIADMKDLLLELDGQYKEFIEQKISKCINKTNSGIYQQF
jgi:glycosyltransferase involved in cell wall biosynthesis